LAKKLKIDFLPKLWLFGHIRKPIKGSKVLDYNLVSSKN